MFTGQNHVWFPHRGCKNLLLPYHVYSDSLKPDSKSFSTHSEIGTSVDNPLAAAEDDLIDIGTCVDTGIAEFCDSLGRFGTYLKKCVQDVRSDHPNTDDCDIEIEAENANQISSYLYQASSDADAHTDEETEDSETQNDSYGSSNNYSDEIEHKLEKLSGSFTYLAFWNFNNCNSLPEREPQHILGNMAGTYIKETPQILKRFKAFSYFPVTEKECLLYENPGEYIFVPGTRGYARIMKDPNWNKRPTWLTKCVSWSCRMCVIGILIIFGYCLCGKYKDMCLYE